ncbi:proteasome assembly chaperone 2, partial [Tremellales sp. Uapishka_1]
MSDFYSAPAFSPDAFSECTLILPSVSLANLPQLAADLLITSLGLTRVGWLGRGETVVPFAGAGEEPGSIVTGGLEVYGKTGESVFIIQQRSPTLKSQKEAHINLLQRFVTRFNFSLVLVLTSLDAASQDDAQLLTPHQHILPPNPPALPAPLERLQMLPPLRLHISAPPLHPTATTYPPFLPSAGLTRRILSALQDGQIPHGAITAWCVEGDNREDAWALAHVVLGILGLNGVEVKEPKSWEGLFGATDGWSGGAGADSEIYG